MTLLKNVEGTIHNVHLYKQPILEYMKKKKDNIKKRIIAKDNDERRKVISGRCRVDY